MLKDIRKNPILLTDCYNLSHQNLKCNTDFEVSHMYNRAAGMILYGFNEIVNSILSIKITEDMVNEAAEYAEKMNLTFPKEIWMNVVNDCDGNIPILVQAVPEGTWCPTGTPFAQVRNTVKGYGEMVTWFEGIFMMAYFPSSCATRAFKMRKYLEEKKKQYGFDEGFLWRFHSFGFRGHKSLEDAYFAGTAWSTFLQGTDDLHIVQHMPKEQIMGSIAALAHKVTQQYDDEYKCFTNAIDYAAESGKNIVALVIDTYNAQRVITEYTLTLAQYAKAKGVHIVFRPDSGNVFEQACQIYTRVSTEGYHNVSVIIGESMSFENAMSMDKKFEIMGVPLNFISYGIGAGFYKDIERDTLGWAMKTGYSNGAPRMKVVKSDPFKQSIPGIIDLLYDEDDLLTIYLERDDNADDSVYEGIYRYDHEQNTTAFIKNMTSIPAQAIKDRAYNSSGYRLNEVPQSKIMISNEIKKLIDEITKKHE
jgi:nicotinamide phosphoribosyltransferase